MLDLGATEDEAMAAVRKAHADQRLAATDSPAEIYWLLRQQGATEEEASAAARKANIERRMINASPAEIYWLMLEGGANEEDAMLAVRQAKVELMLPNATPAEVYGLMLEAGASVEEAAAARDRATFELSLKLAYSPDAIHDLLVEKGSTETEAAELAKSGLLAARIRAGATPEQLTFELRERGSTDAESTQLVNNALVILEELPNLELLLTQCQVYFAVVIYCDDEGEPAKVFLEIAANCWSQFLSQCHLQTCPEGETLFYYLTVKGGCHEEWGSTTCITLSVRGDAYWSPLYDDRLFCRCFEETTCAEIEAECCDEEDGCGDCPECE
jgi:hypothetical protein